MAKHFVLLVVYFILNLSVTLTNKQVLAMSSDQIRRPYLLTAVHSCATFAGCIMFRTSLHSRPSTTEKRFQQSTIIPLSRQQHHSLLLFSLLYTINIALSNWSLALVSLPVYQTTRATAPVLTVAMSVVFRAKPLSEYSTSTRLSLLPITMGVVLATTGGPLFTTSERKINSGYILGVSITFIGTLSAVLKTILTHKLTTRLSSKLSSIDLLHILSPYAAFQSLFFAYINNELGFIWQMRPWVGSSSSHRNMTTSAVYNDSTVAGYKNSKHDREYGREIAVWWVVNATAVFFLNITSFEANKACGPVSMAVAANMKQVVILMLPVVAGSLGSTDAQSEETGLRVGVGTLMAVAGGIWYACSMRGDRNRRSSVRHSKTILAS